MMTANQKKYLSKYFEENLDIDSLDYKTCIISGVGSGKNYWIEKELVKHGNVLLITSRKAKKDETIIQSIFEGKFEAKEVDNFVVYTNSGIEQLIKNVDITGSCDSLCNYFNYIVVDEAHSLITDSVFTDSAFHLWTFIKLITKKVRVILMTGTVEPIQRMLIDDSWNIIDCSEECHNVKPRKIIIDTQDSILSEVRREMNEGGKVIYLANSANSIPSILYQKFTDKLGIEKSSIAFSMSDATANHLIKDKMPEEYERHERTYESIISNQMLPKEIKLLVSTSRLKEGVNIKDDSIKCVICESHIAADILQFSGRVRKGVETLYIVHNAKQNNINNISELDYQFCSFNGLLACNSYLDNIEEVPNDILQDLFGIARGRTQSNQEVMRLVEYVENKFQHIRYNHLENKFEIYEQRHEAVHQSNENIKAYKRNRAAYLKRVFEFTDKQIEDRINEKQKYYKKNIRYWQEIFELVLQNWSDKHIEVFDETHKDFLIVGLCRALGLKDNANIKSINQELTKRKLPFEIKSYKSKKAKTRDKYYLIVIKVDM